MSAFWKKAEGTWFSGDTASGFKRKIFIVRFYSEREQKGEVVPTLSLIALQKGWQSEYIDKLEMGMSPYKMYKPNAQDYYDALEAVFEARHG
jgi:hypothetical protein